MMSVSPGSTAFVRGRGCFSFHMQHTWSRCSSAPSDAIMPLLTGKSLHSSTLRLHLSHFWSMT